MTDVGACTMKERSSNDSTSHLAVASTHLCQAFISGNLAECDCLRCGRLSPLGLVSHTALWALSRFNR